MATLKNLKKQVKWFQLYSIYPNMSKILPFPRALQMKLLVRCAGSGPGVQPWGRAAPHEKRLVPSALRPGKAVCVALTPSFRCTRGGQQLMEGQPRARTWLLSTIPICGAGLLALQLSIWVCFSLQRKSMCISIWVLTDTRMNPHTDWPLGLNELSGFPSKFTWKMKYLLLDAFWGSMCTHHLAHQRVPGCAVSCWLTVNTASHAAHSFWKAGLLTTSESFGLILLTFSKLRNCF